MTNELHDCGGCTGQNNEGTHAMHTKQHPCKEGGDPDCGYCFPNTRVDFVTHPKGALCLCATFVTDEVGVRKESFLAGYTSAIAKVEAFIDALDDGMWSGREVAGEILAHLKESDKDAWSTIIPLSTLRKEE